jgi:hypothetical protein
MGEPPCRNPGDLFPSHRTVALGKRACKNKRRDWTLEILSWHPCQGKVLVPPKGDLALRQANARFANKSNFTGESIEKFP